MKKVATWWEVVFEAAKKFVNNDPFSMGATIGFYTIFSLPAVSVIGMEIAGYFYEKGTIKEELQYQVQELMGPGVSEQIDTILTSTADSEESLLMKIIGFFTLLISATTVFAALQSSLNSIWGVKPKPGKSLMNYVLTRLISLATITSTVFLLVISLLVESLIVFFSTYITSFIPEISEYVVFLVNLFISLGIYVMVFSFIFKVMPDAKTYWSDTRKGALVTAVLFAIGKYGIGIYIGFSALGNSYGAAGSLVALLVWVYYSTIILLFGAQITHEFSVQNKREMKPGKYAVAIKTIELEQ